MFENDREKEIFKENINSLRKFEFIEEYKYILVAISSILEFLLIRCYENHNIQPKNNNFYDYIDIAINNNLFFRKKKWQFKY